MKPTYEDLQQQLAALAAENAALKQGKPSLKTMISALDTYYANDDVPESAMLMAFNILRKGIKTPATDRIVAEAEACGIEKFAAKLRIPSDDQFFDAVAEGVAGAADAFAKQLRAEASK